ncbi:MAG: DMT family transporter [Rickettsiales bacterium]
MNQKRETTWAILMFLGVLLGNTIIFSIVPFLSKPVVEGGFGHHPFQILFCYSAIATLCMLPWARKQGRAGLATTRWKHYGLRAVLEYGAYALTLTSLTYISDGGDFTLPMHTTLNFITPILATIATIFILRERSGAHTWIALIAGIVGVLIVTRPGVIPLNPGVLYALGAAVGFSLCGVVIKLLCSTESPMHIAFYMLAMTTLLAIPMGVTHWTTPTAEGWMWLGVVGLLTYTVQWLVGKAISKVPYMVIIPLNFVQLIFSTISLYVLYGKVLDEWTLAGAVIILAGTMYNAYRNRALAAREVAIAMAA